MIHYDDDDGVQERCLGDVSSAIHSQVALWSVSYILRRYEERKLETYKRLLSDTLPNQRCKRL